MTVDAAREFGGSIEQLGKGFELRTIMEDDIY